MATHPKGKTGLHPRGSMALAAVFLAIASGPALGTQMQDLQRLGAQVRAVADQADLGVPPSQQELASLRRQLEDIDRAAKAAGELALERKYRSIAMFLARIEYRSAHPMRHRRRPACHRSQHWSIVKSLPRSMAVNALRHSDFPKRRPCRRPSVLPAAVEPTRGITSKRRGTATICSARAPCNPIQRSRSLRAIAQHYGRSPAMMTRQISMLRLR